jgi:hypothetical protein
MDTIIHSEPHGTNEHQAAQTKKAIFHVHQIIWYILGIIEVLLALRFILKLTGANPFSGFVDFIYTASRPLAAPFYGIFNVDVAGQSVFEWTTLIAMLVYALVAWGLVKLILLIRPVSEEEAEHEVG